MHFNYTIKEHDAKHYLLEVDNPYIYGYILVNHEQKHNLCDTILVTIDDIIEANYKYVFDDSEWNYYSNSIKEMVTK